MKVLVPTIGSRGDVQPYINLGSELSAAGFDVTVATHTYWKDTIESFGIGFMPLGPDVDIEAEAAAFRRSFNIPAIMKLLNDIHSRASREILEAIGGFDFLIASHLMVGAMEAIKAGKPYVSVTLMPSMVPGPGKSRARELFRSVSDSFYFYVGPWGKTRKRLGLDGITRFSRLLSPDLDLLPISAHLCPPHAGWGKEHVVTGVWELPPDRRPLPAELCSFLEKHGDPIVVALGAMSFDTERDVGTLRTIINAIRKTGNSGIIQGFAHSMKKIDVPEFILPLGPVPHDRLFGRAKIVIHHCGFGTMTTALCHGRPSVAVPNRLDQFFWADTIARLKLSPKPIPARKLSEGLLVAAINACVGDREIRANAARMAELMRAENGLRRARELIGRFVEEKVNARTRFS